MQIKIDFKDLKKFEKEFGAEIFGKAMGRTIQRVATKFKTTTTKEVRKTYNVKAKELKQYIKLKNTGHLERTFIVQSNALGLEKFGARQTKAGVSVLIRKDRGRRVIKGAFLAKDKNNNIRVFERSTKARLPIKRDFTLSAPQMFNKQIIDKGIKEINKMYVREFKHNLDYYLGKIK